MRGDRRVIRGGGWGERAVSAVAARAWREIDPVTRTDDVGFRCAY